MDTSRWKSILVPREVYLEIKEMSKAEGRTMGGQLRVVFDWYKESQQSHVEVYDDRDGSNSARAR